MKKQKTTKRALLLSALSLLLCMAMLVGSTFAWFTDSVTSGRNTIVSGNLDVELYYATLDANNEWTDYARVTASTKVFNENALYEPGYTEVVRFKVVNEGSLALKYTLDAKVYHETAGKNVYGDMFNLSNYLYTGTLAAADYTREAAVAAATTKLSTGFNMKSTSVLNAGAIEELVLVLTMPTTVGNEANYKTAEENAPADKYQPKIDLGINLFATQYTEEEDSYGPDYDEDSWNIVYDENGLRGAVASGLTNIKLGADIVLTEPLIIPAQPVTTYSLRRTAPSGLVLDLGGFTLTLPDTINEPAIINNGSLTLQNGTVAGDIDSTNGAIQLDNNAQVGVITVTEEDQVLVTNYSSYVNIVDAEGTVITVDPADGYVNVEVTDEDGNTVTIVVPGSDDDNLSAIASVSELKAALANGGNYVLANDLEVEETLTVLNGKEVTLDLGNKKIAGNLPGTGNKDMFLVKGKLTVKNGAVELEVPENQGWGAMSAIFDITAGGIVNLESVVADNKGGTDMNFVAHLNNWGEVTLNVKNSTLKATYVPVRVFNSGYDMNNVTIENSKLDGGNYAFWVHNYTVADFGTAEKAEAQKALLNLNIFGKGNTFVTGKTVPIRYGFTNSILATEDGATVASTTEELISAIKNAPVGETTTIALTNSVYAGDIKITLAAMGKQGGDVIIKAVSGANPVITGTVTMGYFENRVGATAWNAKVTFEGISFDHAMDATHSLVVQNVKGLTLKNCTLIGDGEYGISAPGNNPTGTSLIQNCTFKNAGLQLAGNFATGLIIENCTFEESCINVQGGNGVTIQNCTFTNTLTDANVGESFYLVRSNSTPITLKNCEMAINSTASNIASAQAKWGILWNRGSTNWNVEGVEITMTDAALAQTELLVTKTTSTGAINTNNLTVNGVLK